MGLQADTKGEDTHPRPKDSANMLNDESARTLNNEGPKQCWLFASQNRVRQYET